MPIVCEPLCRYVDSHLKPLVELLPLFARDTSDILRKISNILLEEDMWLASWDVEGLYRSISHSDGLEAVKFFLQMNAFEQDLSTLILTS